MRRLRYEVAMSLDGFIAGNNGESDWIIDDPSIDFEAHLRQFDTLVMGRRTFETMQAAEQTPAGMGMQGFVVSTTLRPEDCPGVTVVSGAVAEMIRDLKEQAGKDIWLYGGGVLFRSLLDAGLVDTVELAVIPVLLGSGIPVVPEGRRCSLRLAESTARASGIVMAKYDVAYQAH